MIGLVLAAGTGRRLFPLTADLPKTLLEIAEDRTVLDLVLGNLSAAGIEDVAIVTGFASDQIEQRVPALERRHGVRLELIHNDRALEWNNAYSLWLARETFGEGVVLVNGDTVHPPSIEDTLLAARGPAVLLAIDREKPLGDEQMKVLLGADGSVRRISKGIAANTAAGEYIGVSVIEPVAADGLGPALEATWRRDPGLYYEDGFQEFADRGGAIHGVPIGAVEWVEIDDHDDLARAREIACRC
jgi:choline kinase